MTKATDRYEKSVRRPWGILWSLTFHDDNGTPLPPRNAHAANGQPRTAEARLLNLNAQQGF
jgi:hypothetical protein